MYIGTFVSTRNLVATWISFLISLHVVMDTMYVFSFVLFPKFQSVHFAFVAQQMYQVL